LFSTSNDCLISSELSRLKLQDDLLRHYQRIVSEKRSITKEIGPFYSNLPQHNHSQALIKNVTINKKQKAMESRKEEKRIEKI
jgi:hypothetical protein